MEETATPQPTEAMPAAPQPVQPTPETPTQSTQEPITTAQGSSSKAWILALILLVLVVAAAVYAYSQGLFGVTTTQTASTTPTTDEVQVLDATATQVKEDLADLTANDLDNIDLSGDEDPVL